MANVAVVGAQWGDEGKGKIVDWLSERADVVVRFQGGHNAGHTLVIGDKTFKLSLLPSGVVRPGKLGVIGNGVVVDPWALCDEIEQARRAGRLVSRDNLRIAENATLILPLHRELDVIREEAAGAGKIGTTGRGIGPAYEDKVGRRAIRVQDLAQPGDARRQDRSHPRASQRAAPRPRQAGVLQGRRCMAELTRDRAEGAAVRGRDVGAARHGAPRRQAHPVRGRAGRAARHRSRHLSLRHLVEHGGGAGGDRLGHGPARRSATCSASPRPTRRASAPARSRPSSPTRSASASASAGTSSARSRGASAAAAGSMRCSCARSLKVSGIDGIALTKLDVLDGFEEIKVCVGYMLDGERIDRLPASQRAQARVEPIYETFEGWSQSTRGARSWADLPAQAVKYVRTIEELIECPVTLLSTSPERDDTILMKDPFAD